MFHQALTIIIVTGIIVTAVLYLFRRKHTLFQCTQCEIHAEMFQKAFDVSGDAIVILYGNGKVVYSNKKMQSLLKVPEGHIDLSKENGPKLLLANQEYTIAAFAKEKYMKERNKKMQFFADVELILPRSERTTLLYIYLGYFEPDGLDSMYIVVMRDMSQKVEVKESLGRHRLTGLPNEIRAKEELHQLYSKIHLHGEKLALALFEIDNYSEIRAMLGLQKSEQIEQYFAHFLERYAKAHDLYVYHTFSDHFLLCFPHVQSADEVIHHCRIIQEKLRAFYKINNVQFHLTASVGVSIYPESGSTLHLLDNVYKALVEAKQQGVGHIHIHIPSELEKRYNELEIFSAIHEAIVKEEFEVYYQPIVSTADYKVVGAEALIRWRHPVHGFIPPDLFIPMLEQSGEIIQLGRFVLSRVLKQQKQWELFKFRSLEVSINMSLVEIESEGFYKHVETLLGEMQIDPAKIKFEVTEGAAMENKSRADIEIAKLKKLGIKIALDDFGTGYTSFSYLKKFPADVVKVDRSILGDDILRNEDDQRIVQAIIDLGHTLNMKVVVEGVENSHTANLLRSFGADYLQGYYFGKPQPAYEFQELIRK